ncbi:MAG: ABC transporter ATP-binding protein [Sporichthyaceae bacterium]|nr:ABC transporter ATP-binding protein [Sporichthyaceae bacterium]
MTLLDVQNLSVAFNTADGVVKAVRNASFSVDAGQTLGVVGESGSGKSVTVQSLLGLARGAQVSGQAMFNGADLITMNSADLRQIRGAEIGLVFQDPLTSLHPHYRVGKQIAEMILAHQDVPKRVALNRATELLGQVGIPHPKLRVNDYPHQFSGGMRQRVVIAMAIALEPALLIADEPTTALDVTVQAQILELIKKLQAELNMAVILITHDLGVVADIADSVMVMYAGRPVEKADRDTIYYRSHHPYTGGLLESIPVRGQQHDLRPIPGSPPSLINLPSGCSFHPRCRFVMDRCRTELPPLMQVDAGVDAHQSACWLPASGSWWEERQAMILAESEGSRR